MCGGEGEVGRQTETEEGVIDVLFKLSQGLGEITELSQYMIEQIF